MQHQLPDFGRSHGMYPPSAGLALQHGGPAFANNGATAALETAAAVRQELLQAWAQQAQVQAAQSQVPQLVAQLALMRAAAGIQGPSPDQVRAQASASTPSV